MSRALVKLIVGAAGVVAVLGVGASPAAAHAELVASEPASGQVLDTSPEQVVLFFNEAVDPPGDAIEVFDSSGDQLDVGGLLRPAGDQVAVELPPLDDGAYVVTWRVGSTDSHPIRGAFTFRVGEAGDDTEAQALMERLVASEGGDSTLGVVYGVVRFLGFAGMVVLVGGAAFLLVLWPAGLGDRRARRLVAAGWWTVLVTTVLSFGLQGTYAAGEGLDGIADWSLISEVLDTRAGVTWVVRLVLLAVIAILLAATRTPSPQPQDRSRLVVAALLGLALLATVSAAGHAGAGDLVPLALVVDVVHLAAASVWLGGLVMLVGVALRPTAATADDDAALQPVVRGFSNIAFAAVVTLVVTGTIQGIRQVQSLGALTGTTYGRLLIAKVLVVATVVAVAGLSRRWVRQRWPIGPDRPASVTPEMARSVGAASSELDTEPRPEVPEVPEVRADGRPPLSALRRSVGVEVVIAAVVLAVTALLVNAVPADDDYAPTFSTELHGDVLLVELEVDPAKAGRTDIEVRTLTHAGEPLAVEELTGTLSLPARDIGPIPVGFEAHPDTVGLHTAADTEVPLSGTWELVLTARTSQFDESEVTAEVPIR